jgi:hypothetical protein
LRSFGCSLTGGDKGSAKVANSSGVIALSFIELQNSKSRVLHEHPVLSQGCSYSTESIESDLINLHIDPNLIMSPLLVAKPTSSQSKEESISCAVGQILVSC